jgi:hypothetical protein
MFPNAKHRWSRRGIFAGALFAAALTMGVTTRPIAAEYGYGHPGPAYSYSSHSNPYHQHGRWGSHDSGWHRGWAEGGRGHGAWGHAGRGNEGFSGSSSGGRGGGYAVHGSRAGGRVGGSGNGYVNWLGAHAR